MTKVFRPRIAYATVTKDNGTTTLEHPSVKELSIVSGVSTTALLHEMDPNKSGGTMRFTVASTSGAFKVSIYYERMTG